MKISRIGAREILYADALPALECTIWLNDGSCFTGTSSLSISSARQSSQHQTSEYAIWSKSAQKACTTLKEIIGPTLVGHEIHAPALDILLKDLDGTNDGSRLGHAVLMAASIALYKAHAHAEKLELFELIAYQLGFDTVTLPCPQATLISTLENSGCLIKEFILAPAGALTLQDAIENSMALFYKTLDSLRQKNLLRGISLSGSLIVEPCTDQEILDCLSTLFMKENIKGSDFLIALATRAPHLYNHQENIYTVEGQAKTPAELITTYQELVYLYPVHAIYDGFSSDDHQGWELFRQTLNATIYLVSDMLFEKQTSLSLTQRAQQGSTAAVINPSVHTSITQVLSLIEECRTLGLSPIVTDHLDEHDDTWLVDIAVGTSCDQLCIRGYTSSQRVNKYNRLRAIEEFLLTRLEKSS